ncbi:MAG: hypothetical protein ACP5QO_09375 [Clostridia bacterium]
MKNWMLGASTLVAAGLVTFAAQTAFASTGPFSTEVASQVVVPTHTSVVHFETATVMIPAGTFTTPVRFSVWQGPLDGFNVPSGQKAIFDFKFMVTTLNGSAVALPFTKTVLFSLHDPQVTAASGYYNVVSSGDSLSLVSNPLTLTINGARLTHRIGTDAVGWVVTAPAMGGR